MELLYGADSPYARFSTTASIKAITRQDLIDFHRTCWQPSNISLAIYGDFQTKEMIGLLDRTLGGWKSDVHLQPAPPAVTTEPRGGTYFIEKKGLQQATIILGHLGPARHGPDHYALIPMNYILGTGGFNSRLMRELRSNRGLTYGVDGGVSEGIIRGILDVEMTTSNENAALAVETARKLLADFGAGTIAPEERQVAFNYLENSFVFKFNSTGQVLSQTIVKKLQGYPETYWATYPDKIRGVTDDQMLAAARRYIHPDQLVVLIVGDKEKLAEQLKKLGRCTELPFPKT